MNWWQWALTIGAAWILLALLEFALLVAIAYGRRGRRR